MRPVVKRSLSTRRNPVTSAGYHLRPGQRVLWQSDDGNYLLAYVEAAVPRIERLGPMQHLLGTSFIDFEGDIAYVETYIWTFLRVQADGRDLDTFTGGRLIDRFERRDGAWKIAHRRTIFDWNRDTPSNEAWVGGMFTPGKPGMLQGRKGSVDPSYERF